MNPCADRKTYTLPSSRILVHYGEIGIKGANRHVFEGALERNIRDALEGLPGVKVRRRRQRIYVNVADECANEAKERLSRVFGIVWLARVESSPSSYPDILEAAVKALGDCPSGSSFRVSARRSDKSSEMGSQELARKLGEDIMKRLGLKVDLTDPDSTLFVDVVWGEVLLYRERTRGPGGLPLGSTGPVLHLLSGGIDSPAAAWLMMKRGSRPTYLHFYLAPTPESVIQSKIVDLVRVLGRYSGDGDLILIPFSPYQLATMSLPTEYEPIVFRRFVRMVSERVAAGLDIQAISTGDNLAQVASQTLQNLVCIDSGASCPTFRPLLTYDKEEIVTLAKKVGTYELSVKEYKDCCSIVSKHPRTRMKVQLVDEAARHFRFEELAQQCIDEGTAVIVSKDSVASRPLRDLIPVPTGPGTVSPEVTSRPPQR